ncbi:uncharacterized protein LOC113287504 [Papaver somniferum]|uniref:uncharacterized protein LOC113287504 n=1 Tax=Papaver somniferum TaxID=3469 RepID=UPI000E6FF179|nr:uncharacterized protein LOC113287504 [Papaver somniferum]XP_026392066.1 uncharacterized protein LOC113287504 [Papaver somniferum]XP_026392067.1 uncharacterized protein LOC113287504 [Papaver somniferum]
MKKMFGWSRNSVTYLLGRLKNWFPKGNTFPAKYPTMKSMLIDLGMKAESIHACPNHCVLYRKENEKETVCPNCGASRYVVKQGKYGQITTKVLCKVLRHFKLTPRLRRFYTISWIARYMTWNDEAHSSPKYMRHPVDSLQWQNMKTRWPDFSAEAQNVWLGISTDGFNPRGIQRTSYSYWPVILVMYNLPPSLCMKEEFQIMSLLIPGQKAPGQAICVFLQPLIDKLIKFWIDGFASFDMYRKETFICRSILMWSIHHLPAYGNVSGCTKHGYKACTLCADETESIWLGHCRKIVYLNYRKFLKIQHPFRSGKYLGLKTAERKFPPPRLSGEDVLLKTSNIEYLPGKLSKAGKKRKRDIIRKLVVMLLILQVKIFIRGPIYGSIILTVTV